MSNNCTFAYTKKGSFGYLFLFLTKIKIKSKRYKLSDGVNNKVLNWVYVKTGYLDNWKKIKESEIKKREYKKISAK